MSEQKISVPDVFKAAALKQRVVTALIIAAVFIATVVWLPLFHFQLVIALLFSVAAWEWANLSGFDRQIHRLIYVFLVLQLVAILQLWMQISFYPLHLFIESAVLYNVWIEWLSIIAMIFWIVALLVIVLYPRSTVVLAHRSVRLLMGLFVLIPTWACVVFLKQQHLAGGLILLVIAMIAGADIGAYFVGVRFGKHKLAPAVSPGKSWEGVVGGLLFNMLLVAVLAVYWHLTIAEVILFVKVTVAVVIFSIVGDLFESMLKRHRGIKDSGGLLPGHGGVLDRIDGWMAAVPVFTLAYLVFAA